MNPVDPLAHGTLSTTRVDGLEVELFTTVEEALVAFATVPSYVEQQTAAFVAQTAPLVSLDNKQ